MKTSIAGETTMGASIRVAIKPVVVGFVLIAGLLTAACTSPDRRIRIGAASEILYPKPNFIYAYHYVESKNADGRTLLQAYVSIHGQEIRFGNDQGYSSLGAANEKYIAWTYKAFRKENAGATIESGLYVYVIETGQNVMVEPGWNVGQSKIDGDWILYATWDDQPSVIPWIPNTQVEYTVRLVAYNTVAHAKALLTDNIPAISGRTFRSFYALSGSQAGWIEYDVEAARFSIKLCNLADRQARTLAVETKHPLFLSLSDKVAVWRDEGWYGYSLEQDVVFGIPDISQDLKDAFTQTVTAVDGGLEWRVQVGLVTRYYSTSVNVR